MQRITLQEELGDDFNAYEVVVSVLHTHIQQNGILKRKFNIQIVAMLERIIRAEKAAKQAMTKANKR